MIKDVLNTVIISLNKYIYEQIYTGNSEDLDQSDKVVILGNLADRDNSTEESLDDRVILSIINIQQESLLRNLPSNKQIYDNEGLPSGIIRNHGVYLNIYILIGANNKIYGTALDRISDVITFFQKNPVLKSKDMTILPNHNIDKIIFDLYSTTFEELNHFWGIMGGKYIPSVVYKMQLVFMDGSVEEGKISLVKSIISKSNTIG